MDTYNVRRMFFDESRETETIETDLATGIGMEGECISHDVYEYDDEGQRIVYLHAIDSKEG